MVGALLAFLASMGVYLVLLPSKKCPLGPQEMSDWPMSWDAWYLYASGVATSGARSLPDEVGFSPQIKK
jgi:hypothetical protein